jgi:hypothetical protein
LTNLIYLPWLWCHRLIRFLHSWVTSCRADGDGHHALRASARSSRRI